MTRDEMLAALAETNPKARLGHLTLYVDAFLEYQTAQKNISENGAIVMHPRTGQPIENPFLLVRDRASKTLRDPIFSRLNTDEVW